MVYLLGRSDFELGRDFCAAHARAHTSLTACPYCSLATKRVSRIWECTRWELECLPALRLVFPNDSGSMAALARLKLENLDIGILGGEFPETRLPCRRVGITLT